MQSFGTADNASQESPHELLGSHGDSIEIRQLKS